MEKKSGAVEEDGSRKIVGFHLNVQPAGFFKKCQMTVKRNIKTSFSHSSFALHPLFFESGLPPACTRQKRWVAVLSLCPCCATLAGPRVPHTPQQPCSDPSSGHAAELPPAPLPEVRCTQTGCSCPDSSFQPHVCQGSPLDPVGRAWLA